MSQIRPPWTPGQVADLNAFQAHGCFHPFTCGNRGDGQRPADAVLVATEQGWTCPHCPYTQSWAHDFMAEEPS